MIERIKQELQILIANLLYLWPLWLLIIIVALIIGPRILEVLGR